MDFHSHINGKAFVISFFIFFLNYISVLGQTCPDKVLSEATIVATDERCYQAEDGTITIEFIGGTGDFTPETGDWKYSLFDAGFEGGWVYDEAKFTNPENSSLNPNIVVTLVGPSKVQFSNLPPNSDGIGYRIFLVGGDCGGPNNSRDFTIEPLGVTVGEAPQLDINLDNLNDNSNCNAPFNGSFDVSISGGQGTIVYDWSGPNGFTSNLEDIGSLESGTYDLIVEDQFSDANGNYTCSVSESYIIDLIPRSADFSYSQSDFCLTLASNPVISLAPGAIAGTFSSIPGINLNPITGEIDLSTSTAGSYVVTNTLATDGICPEVTFNVNVNLLDPPSPSIIGNLNVCFGDTEVYTTQTGSGENNYVWTVNGGTILSGGTATDNTIEIVWDQAGPYDVSVNYDRAGCTAALPATANITVNPLPTPTILGNLTVCFGDTEIYTTETGSGENNYVWTVNGGTILSGGTATDNTIEIVWDQTGPYDVSVNYDNASGCGAPSATTENITVNPLPTPTITQGGLPPDTEQCENATISYQTSNTYTTYSWNVLQGGTITSGTNAFIVDVDWDNNDNSNLGILELMVSDGTCNSVPVTINVNINPAPIDFDITSPNPVVACEGETYQIIGANSQTNVTYDLIDLASGSSLGDFTGNDGTPYQFDISLPSAGSPYELLALATDDNSGCTQNMDTLNITVNPIPVALDQSYTICEDIPGSGITSQSLSIFDGDITPTAGATVAWYSDAAATIPAPDPVNISTGDDFYAVVSSTNGCTDTAVVDFTVPEAPEANDLTPTFCSDAIGGTDATIDLTSLNALVSTTAGATVQWFTDPGRTGADEIVAPALNNFTISDGTTLYTRVTLGSCINDAQAAFIINSTPTVAAPPLQQVCEDLLIGPGQASFDLTSLSNGINAGADSIVWYTDAGFTARVADDTYEIINNGASRYALVWSNNCTNSALVNFQVVSAPDIDPVTINECEETFSSGQVSNYDLTIWDNDVNGGSGDVVRYYSDAALTAEITAPITISDGETYFTEVDNGSCTNTSTLDVTINRLPEASNATTDICQDPNNPGTVDGVDLTSFDTQINTNAGVTTNITWFDGGMNPVGTPDNVNGVTDGTVFNAVVDSAGCQNMASLTINLNSVPAQPVITGNFSPNCSEAGVVYSVTDVPGSTFTWTVPTGASFTASANNEITVDFADQNGFITVFEIDANGCESLVGQQLISLQGCPFNVALMADDTAVCSGGDITFTNLTTGADAAATYNWYFGNPATTNPTPATANGFGPDFTVNYAGNGIDTVVLEVVDPVNGTETDTVFINIQAVPTASIAALTPDACEGSTASLEFSFTGPGPYDITYTDGISTFNETTSNNPFIASVSPIDTTTYELLSVNNGICAGTIASNLATINVAPTQFVEINLENVTVNPGETFTVPVRINDWDTVTNAAFTINWNPVQVSYDGFVNSDIQNIGAANFDASLAGGGILTFNWSTASMLDTTITNNTILFELSFTAIGIGNCNNTAISIDPAGVAPLSIGTFDGLCEAVVNVSNGQINTLPAPPIPDTDTVGICLNGNGDIDLGATPVSGGLIRWFEDASLTTEIATGNILDINLNTTTAYDTVFYLTQEVTGCGVSDPDSVRVIISDFTGTPGIVADVPSACPGDPVTFTASPAGQAQYDFFINGVLAVSGSNEVFVVDTLSNQDSVSVSITNAGGCSVDVDGIKINITEFIVDAVVTDPTGCGGNDGTITINSVSGGTGPYSFLYSSSPIPLADPTNPNQSSLVAGTYQLQITEDAGANCSQTFTYNLRNPVPFRSSIVDISNVTTFGGSDGFVTIGISPQQPGYNVSWTGTGTITNPNQTTDSLSTISNLTAGDYKAIISDGICIDSLLINITQPLPGGGGNLLVDVVNLNDVSTCGAADGSIEVSVIGGSGNYTYLWSKVGDPTFSAPDAALINGLDGGQYSVEVRDVNSPTLVGFKNNINVTEPPQFILTTSTVDNQTCSTNGGQIIFTINGGVGPKFGYSINGVDYFSYSAPADTITNLGAATYNLMVIDSGSMCMTTEPVIVNNGPDFNVNVSTGNAACNTSPTGEALLTVVSGGSGNGNYYYSVDNGVTYQPFIGTDRTNFKNLLPGSYSYLVKDSLSGCEVSLVANVGVSNSLIADAGFDETICADTLQLKANNPGTGNIGTWSLFSPVDPAVTFDDVNEAGTKIRGLSSLTTYTLVWTVEDNGGVCSVSDTVLITTEDLTDCPTGACPITATVLETVPSTCFNTPNGSVRIEVAGGTSPYEYTIDGTNWFTFVSGNFINGLPIGDYNIAIRQVSDPSCTDAVAISMPSTNPEIVFDGPFVTILQPNCQTADGQVEVPIISGGQAPYDYTLDGVSFNMPADRTITGLTAGRRDFQIIDNTGCTVDTGFVVTSPGKVIASLNEEAVRCSSIQLKSGIEIVVDQVNTDVSGPYEAVITGLGQNDGYLETFQIPAQGTKTVLGLEKGFYNVVVQSTSGNGCAYEEDIQLSEGPSPVGFDIIDRVDVVPCQGDFASITIGNPRGDQDTIFYANLLNDAGVVIQSTELTYAQLEAGYTFSNIEAGNYQVQLTQNQDGCESITELSEVLIIGEPNTPLAIDIRDSGVSLTNKPTGHIVAELTSISGGAPYLSLIQLTEPNPVTPITPAEIIEFNDSQDFIEYDEISNGIFRVRYDDLYSATYTLIAEDAFGCQVTLEFDLGFDNTLVIPNVFTPNDDGFNDDFDIINLPAEGSQLVVSNRSGKIVYESDNYTIDNLWDGGEVNDGIYFYVLSTPDGEEYKGWVEIWRGARP
jgi:gliding motility-associated-like protein